VEMTSELDKGLQSLNGKFDDNKNYFTRYFIIILVTILTGLVVGGAAFVLNR
jgi:CHASE3 domain sensor protein